MNCLSGAHEVIPPIGKLMTSLPIDQSPVYFKVSLVNKPSPCVITFEKESTAELSISFSLTDKKPKEEDYLTKWGKKTALTIVSPPRDKLFLQDTDFLEDFAYLTLESS